MSEVCIYSKHNNDVVITLHTLQTIKIMVTLVSYYSIECSWVNIMNQNHAMQHVVVQLLFYHVMEIHIKPFSMNM